MGPAGTQLSDNFAMICELGNIFLVRPENLRPLLQEGLLAKLDARFTVQFIGQRADFRAAKLDAMFPEISTGSLASFFALTSADI